MLTVKRLSQRAVGLRGLHVETSSVAPSGWVGPRGNFVPAGAADELRAWPECTQTLFTSPPGLTNLDTGAPDVAWLKAAQDAYVQGVAQWAPSPDSHLALQYGPTRGTFDFRASVADLLTKEYGSPVGPERIIQTSGATSGLARVLGLFADQDPRHKVVFIEDPTYFLAPGICREAGFGLEPVPVDGSGLDVSRLEEKVLAAKKAGRLDGSGPFAGIVYCVPTFHNPTSTVMPLARRQELVALCQRHRLLCVSDDVYELLNFGAAPPRIAALDAAGQHPEGLGHVVSNGTFSKILSPGVRTGWIEAAPKLGAKLAAGATVASAGAPAQLTGQVIAKLCRDGTQAKLLKDTRNALAKRAAAVLGAFDAPGCTLRAPQGGMCLWLEAPKHVDMHQVLCAARLKKVSFKPGDLFSPSGAHRNCARLVVAHYDEAALVAAVQTLGEVLREFC